MWIGRQLPHEIARSHIEQTELCSRLSHDHLRVGGYVHHFNRFIQLSNGDGLLARILKIPHFRGLVHTGGDHIIVSSTARGQAFQDQYATEMGIQRGDQVSPFDFEDIHS